MTSYEIAVIVGGVSRDSINRKLASTVERLGPPDFSFKRLQICDRPLYNDDADQSATVKKLKAEIKAAGGLWR
jgi:chromate reductase, NAD(P)H dehydrogenase (quinone)